jgi:hypothetical protein
MSIYPVKNLIVRNTKAMGFRAIRSRDVMENPLLW